MKPRNTLLLKNTQEANMQEANRFCGEAAERYKWTLRKVQEERGLLPRLGQGPFVLAHWNANFCPIVPRKPLSFLSLEALSHSLVLGGLHQLLLLAENLRRFYFSECRCAQASFLCFDRFLNLIFIFSPVAFFIRGQTTRLWFPCQNQKPSMDGHKNPRVFCL